MVTQGHNIIFKLKCVLVLNASTNITINYHLALLTIYVEIIFDDTFTISIFETIFVWSCERSCTKYTAHFRMKSYFAPNKR